MLKKLVFLCAVAFAGACVAAVDVNLATEAELDSIKGLGPASTARILKAREQGPFASWKDLMARVKGIKASTAEKLSAGGLTVGDAPYLPNASNKP